MICSIYRKFLLCNKSNKHGAASGYKDSLGTGTMRDLSTWRTFADCKSLYSSFADAILTYAPKLTIC